MKKTIYLAKDKVSEEGKLVEITGKEFNDIVTSVIEERRNKIRHTYDIYYDGN